MDAAAVLRGRVGRGRKPDVLAQAVLQPTRPLAAVARSAVLPHHGPAAVPDSIGPLAGVGATACISLFTPLAGSLIKDCSPHEGCCPGPVQAYDKTDHRVRTPVPIMPWAVPSAMRPLTGMGTATWHPTCGSALLCVPFPQ